MERFASDGSFGNKGADEGGVIWPDVFGEGGSVVGKVEHVPTNGLVGPYKMLEGAMKTVKGSF